MATWYLRTKEKKNCIEREFWRHPDHEQLIVREIGWRWGNFVCESDVEPDIDLDNPDGFSVYDSGYDFEVDLLDDGCWDEVTYPDSIDDDERERLNDLWDEDMHSAWEEAGLEHVDTEVELHGELELEKKES